MTPDCLSREGSPQPVDSSTHREVEFGHQQITTAIPIPLSKLAHLPQDIKCSQSAPGSPSRPSSMYILLIWTKPPFL